MLVAKDMLRLPAPGDLPIAGRFVFGTSSKIAAVLPRGGAAVRCGRTREGRKGPKLRRFSPRVPPLRRLGH